MRHELSHAGRRMLDRRDFIQWGGTGLSSIALAALLHEQRLLGGEPPIRPLIDPAHPYAPRQPHFPAKAKRVLMIFCSGALSHIDTFDYKPELVKRHDTPMPTASGEKVITFQGEQGNRRQKVGCHGLAASRGGGGRGGLRAVRRGHARLQLLKSCGRSSHAADGGRDLEERDRHDRAGRSTRIERGGRNACVELRGGAADAGGGK